MPYGLHTYGQSPEKEPLTDWSGRWGWFTGEIATQISYHTIPIPPVWTRKMS